MYQRYAYILRTTDTAAPTLLDNTSSMYGHCRDMLAKGDYSEEEVLEVI